MIRLSTKQKREVYSLSSMLLHLIVFVILLITLNSCTDEDLPQISYDVPATVQNMRGLDGSGFVFVLDNGQRLQPTTTPLNNCGTSSDLTTPGKFSFTDGQKVFITYKKSSKPAISLLNQNVEITGIRNFNKGKSSVPNS